MSLANERLIPNFVSAGSALSVRRKFMKLQLRSGKVLHWRDPVFDGKKWFIWYSDLADDTEINQAKGELIEEAIDGN